MTQIFDEILKKRGVGADFLRPEYHPEDYPELPDLTLAVERIKRARKKQEKVLIYGDYDADGVTASTVMREGLKLVGVKAEVMLPDRFKDGYGMSERLVERAKKESINLVVTVDCGSNNAEIVNRLNELGIDTIVTDHHEFGGDLPKAVAVINPKRKDFDDQDMKALAGVGVAFMVVYGLVKAGLIPAGQEKWLLDLVLIGTICDSMTLTGLNRELCFYGMKVLGKTRRVGLKELMHLAGMKVINSETVGFLIGPRINAAGRMGSAKTAYNLLNTESKSEAIKLAGELNELNEQRKKAQGIAVKEVMALGVPDEPVLVVQGKWHEGILGIVAGRLLEEYKRPTLVLSEVEEGVLKGSGRSFGEFNLAEALRECQKWLVTGGGHMSACGLKVLMVNFEKFKKAINAYYRKLDLKNQERFLKPEADLTVDNLQDLTVELVNELKMLEPYGEGNLEPIFRLNGVKVLNVQRMGEEEKHLRLTVQGSSGLFKTVAFYAPKAWLEVKAGQTVDLWLKLALNEWNGQESVEGRIVALEV